MKKRIVGIKEKIQEITILVKEYVNSKKFIFSQSIQEIKDSIKIPNVRMNAIVEGKKKQPGQKHR